MMYVCRKKSQVFHDSHPLSNCVGVKFDVSKLRFVFEMFMRVQDSSTTWEGPFEVRVQFP
jgi:hypothetical protein